MSGNQNQLILAAAAGLALLVAGRADAQTLDAALDNGVVKVGVARLYGGAIVWLSASGGANLVNNADKGRQIQQSYYAGNNVTATNQCPAWSPWPWNPIMVGDCAGNASPVLTLASSGGQIYAKTQPRLWDRNTNSVAQAYMEQWISFHTALSNVVIVDSKFTCFRDSGDEWGTSGTRDQELPACYFVACLGTIWSCTNSTPWQSGALATITNSFPWTRYTPTEQWSACVNSSSWGAGIYTPISTASLAGKAGSDTTCSTTSGSTMYIAPLGRYAFGRTSTFSYRYYLVVGTLSEIRSVVYALHSKPPLPTGLTATAGNGRVSLAWNAVADATSYKVKRSASSNGPYATVASGLTAASYTDTGLTNGVTCYYVVSSASALGESTNSIPASATPACNFSITVPNHGFESPVLGSGGSAYQYNPSGGSWTFNNSGVSGNGSAFTSKNPSAPQGAQVAFLQQGQSFSQTLTGFVVGAECAVSFAAAQRANTTQAGQTWNVTINGTVIGSFAPAQTATNYTDYTASFTATAATNTLAFVGTNLRGGDNTAFIDNVRVTVLDTTPPAITSSPSNQTVCAGAPAAFTVTAAGANPSYQWRRSGTNISGATGTKYLITAASPEDAGSYDVAVSGMCGSTNSTVATLTVVSPPVIGSPAVVGGTLGFWISGGTGLSYTVYGSTNLVDWDSLFVTNPLSSPFQFTDPAASTFNQRFYKVRAGF